MACAVCNPYDEIIFSPGDLTELVRGTDQLLVGRLAPLVRRQSLTLDLGQVERIDAAGIAALISLYGTARDAGHNFNVVNPARHVAEILELVGLDRVLVYHNANFPSHSGLCLQHSAA